MQTRTVEQVESWESRPFSGGFDSLQDLSEADFTGTVVADGTWLFMLNGRVVGVFEGSIDDFGSGDGTIYDAPDDSLPLLFSMQERGGSTRAKYFTNDTPIAEADQTLTEANFTGYLELSENVLSGDYYLVYYGGKRMSAAFIGQSERLFTGQEAYDRAADEVGIYEVKDVSMNITEIPATQEPASDQEPVAGATSSPTSESTTGAGSDSNGSVREEDVESVVDEAESPGGTLESSPESSVSPTEEVGDDRDTSQSADSGEGTGPAEPGVDTESPETSDEPERETDVGAASGDSKASEEREDDYGGEDAAPTEEPSQTEPDSPDHAAGEAAVPEESEPSGAERDELERMFQEEEEWRQTRSIPPLDPDETEPREESDSRPQPRRSETAPPARQSGSPDARSSDSGVTEAHVEELREAIEEREEQIENLMASMRTVKEERSELEGELDQLRAERDDLEERVSNLESALQRAKDQQSAIDTTASELSPGEALSGTNLFVRYDSKGKPTLDALSAGEVDPEALNENLQLEHHTEFEAEHVVVEGDPFEEFLETTSSYRFISWLVRRFPYELLESGKRSALGDLYDAIPTIDRIEFEGVIGIDETGDQPGSPEFGVVMRDRMGNPVIVAELNDSRDPVRGEEMVELIESATAVGDTKGSLSGAFYVTASFFEPAALEAAEDAESGGGLFRRSDKASYVKTANKSGFHLCLVEDRAETLHVTVPEL